MREMLTLYQKHNYMFDNYNYSDLYLQCLESISLTVKNQNLYMY